MLWARQVPEASPLAPSMKGEIGAYGWFPIDQLPDSYDANQQGFRSADGTRHHFHNVWQFIGRLKRWIRRSQGKAAAKGACRKQGKAKSAKNNGQATDLVVHTAPKIDKCLPQNGSYASGTAESSAPVHKFHFDPTLAGSEGQSPPGSQPLKMNGTAHHHLPSSSSSDSQASSLFQAQLPTQHPWLGFKLNVAQILDQLK